MLTNFAVEWLTLVLWEGAGGGGGGGSVEILSRRMAILINVLRGFPPSLQTNAGIIP
jgi:hypothetical protein